MATQKYEDKRVISVCGVLDKNEEGEYIITVEKKDFLETYNLQEILDSILGNVISISSDIY